MTVRSTPRGGRVSTRTEAIAAMRPRAGSREAAQSAAHRVHLKRIQRAVDGCCDVFITNAREAGEGENTIPTAHAKTSKKYVVYVKL